MAKNRSKSYREEREKKEILKQHDKDVKFEQKLQRKKEKEEAKKLRYEMKLQKKLKDYDDL